MLTTEQKIINKAKATEPQNLQRQLSVKDKQIADLQRQNSDLQSQLTAKSLRVDYCKRQLPARNKKVSSLNRQLSSRNGQIADLLIQLSAKNEQVTNLHRQVRRLREIVSTLDETNSSENIPKMQRNWEIDRNEIIVTGEVLGQGAWGTVFQGKFRRNNVAVKEMSDVLWQYRHLRTAFEREVGIASRCRHPCLLQFIGATNDQAGLLLITELMDRSLRSLYQDRPLTEREIAVISLDVAQALNYLHQNKPDPIIHRDISSANVLLWRQGEQWRGKVSDYITANLVRKCGIDDPGAAIYCAPEALGKAKDQIITCKVSFGKTVTVKRIILK